MKHFRVWFTCVLMMAAVVAQATTIVLPTDEQLVSKSPVIVEATVVSSAAVDRGDKIWTETTLSVTRALKGEAAGNIVVAEIGGVVGNRITKIFGAPEYAAGEHVLAFLTKTPRGDYQTVDLYVGKFAEQATLSGERLWVRHDESADASLLGPDFQPIRARNVQRRADGFERFIAARVAGQSASQNYGVENPVVTAPRPSGRFQSNFTLISEPQIYRWFAFQNGQSAKWYSSGSQAGFTGGGVNEINTAMSAWTGYTSALIRYSYNGAESGAPKPLDQNNGVNEVLFNDPFQEIAGTFGGSGVVGVGGFNGVSGASSWTGPFDADAQHRAAAYTAYNITEAGLTIQDGVSPSTGVTSNELAEIVAHEFGHTLGFGHSTDSTALMYPTVTGRGPSLRTDDQTAARWLYPNGSAPPPPPTVPNAPSGLTATPSGTNVALGWNDNATNETGESVYYAIGNGGFTKVTDVAASTRSVTLTGFAPGTYRFYVTAYNSAGESAASNTASATIASSTLTASFSVSPSSGIANSTVFTFTDQSTGSVTARSWTFGDGATSTASTPTHLYTAPGQYTVTLTVSNSGASSQTSRTVSVSQALAASFSFSPANPTAGQSIQFSDQSAGGPASWSWDFGDGSNSAQQNPAKVYGNAGTYLVRLTVFNGGSSNSTTRNVVVASSAPVVPNVNAAFDFAPSSPQNGESVSFFDRSSGSPSQWFWNFGDGSSSTAQNPTHAFALSGTYTVTLAAYNAVSSSIVSHQVVVAQPAAFHSLVSAAAQTNGAGGSVWRTELTIFNAGAEPAFGQFIFLPSAGGSVQTRPIYLMSKQSVTYANALLEIFGMPSGAGALAIEAQSATSTPNLKITSRTFTTGSAGTYGQAVPQVSDGALQQSLYLTGMESDASFRTNIGLVNRSNDSVGAQLTLVDANGNTVGTSTVVVSPNNFSQAALSAFFPSVSGGNYASLSMRITTGAPGAISAYASIIDNRTQDPVYIQAVPLASASRLIIPAAGRLPGANGTFWRSDVTLFNPNGFTPQTVTLRYRAAGSDNRNAPSRQYTVLGGRTIVLADVLAAFGLSSGSGALEVTWSAGNAPVVTSRTYTTVEGGGTYGQSIDPVAAFSRDAFVPGLRSDFSFRSNVGFVNDSDVTTGVTVSLLASNGQTLATAFVQLAPKSQSQSSVAALFPGVDVSSLGTFTLQAHDDSGQLFAYGSIVDNASGDPVFFAGQ